MAKSVKIIAKGWCNAKKGDVTQQNSHNTTFYSTGIAPSYTVSRR